MCGIWGWIGPEAPARGEWIERMHGSLRHRGPDAEGMVEVAGGVMGHRRLSIIDLSEAATQPLWDATGTACISFNGEIYNYRELRRECESRGGRFTTLSDTEVIVNLYLSEGEKAFDRLNGMFAFALHDSRSGETFLVRDPMGIKPLYFTARGRSVAFASELRALLRGGAASVDIDLVALQAYMQLDFVPAPMTILTGVHKLPGGHRLRIRRDGSTDLQLYSTLAARETPAAPSAREDLARFGRTMRDVVQRQLVADVPVGVFLSGGIDSSIVAAVARDITGALDTFSIAFEEPSFDEREYAATVATTIGSRHHVETVNAAAMLELVPDIARITSEPLADGSIFPTALLARFARRSVKVALSGDGADELFAGYPTHAVSRLGRLASRLPRKLRASLASGLSAVVRPSEENLSLDFKVRKFLEGADRDEVLQNQRWLGSFQPEEAGEYLAAVEPAAGESICRLLQDASGKVPPERKLERLLRTDRRLYLQEGVLVKVDRATMASSLEVRVPFLDNELVAFANGLPADRKLRGGSSKWLLRQYARERFPATIWRRPKKGFGAPLSRWFRQELRELVWDTLSPESLRRHGLFRPEAIRELLHRHQTRRTDERKRILNLLMFQLWYDWAVGDD